MAVTKPWETPEAKANAKKREAERKLEREQSMAAYHAKAAAKAAKEGPRPPLPEGAKHKVPEMPPNLPAPPPPKGTKPPIIKDPKHLWEYYQEYVQDLNKNPMYETKLAGTYNRIPIYANIPHVPPQTMHGFRAYIGVSRRAFQMWRHTDHLGPVIELIEESIFSQSFSQAAVGLANATLIGRYLGIHERVENINRNFDEPKDVTPVEINPDEADAVYLHPDDNTGTGPRLTHSQWEAAKRGELPLES